MFEKVTIASLDINMTHIIGIGANINMDRLGHITEYISSCSPQLKFILIPADDVKHVNVCALTDDQIKILKEQLK